MIIDCISDLHGHYPELEGGDLLIIAGDLTARDQWENYVDFFIWIEKIEEKYKKIVVVAGNHDVLVESKKVHPASIYKDSFVYLQDSGTVFEYEEQVPHPASNEHVSIDVLMYETKKLKIWGSPWTKTFPGMNPHCKAFTVDTDEELAAKFALIPYDTDILITHSPPHGILDKCSNGNVGSKSLRIIMGRVRPRLWICGHIHEGYGEFKDETLSGIQYHIVNASHVNKHYQPVNKPIRIILNV